RDGRLDCVRMVRASRHAAPARQLTMLRVDIEKQLGAFSLSAASTSEGRVTGLFGASGAGKTSLINMIAGLLRPDRGIIALDGETLDDTAARAHLPPHPSARRSAIPMHVGTCRRTGAASVTCSRKHGCFLISTSGRTSTMDGA